MADAPEVDEANFKRLIKEGVQAYINGDSPDEIKDYFTKEGMSEAQNSKALKYVEKLGFNRKVHKVKIEVLKEYQKGVPKEKIKEILDKAKVPEDVQKQAMKLIDELEVRKKREEKRKKAKDGEGAAADAQGNGKGFKMDKEMWIWAVIIVASILFVGYLIVRNRG